MAGLYPLTGDPIYPAAKAGVVHLTHSLGVYWSRWRIRVNCVCPGITDTPLSRTKTHEVAAMTREAPRSMMRPEAIARAVLKLIEDDSQVGQVVEVRPSGVTVIEPRRAPLRRS